MFVKTFDVCCVSASFDGHAALSEISHAFAPGKWTHILGANGAGKSTLLRILAGLLKPSSGNVQLNECDLFAMNALERSHFIAYVPQRLESLPSIRVIDFTMQGAFAQIKTESPDDIFNRALLALQTLGMESFAERRLNELSGGELQLCVLASAIAQQAKIILLDEPTSALDPRHTEIFCLALQKLVQQGVTVISTTHDLSIARRFAHQTVLLSEGKCLWHGDGFPENDMLAEAYQLDASYFEQFRAFPTSSVSIPQEHSEERICPQNRHLKLIVVTSIVFVAMLLALPWFGATWIMPNDDIFWMLRIPRVIWGALAGAVLGLVGASLQALFQNSLATPYTLGMASGASFGAMTAIQLGISGMFGLPLCACIGGFATLAAVLCIGSRLGMRNPLYCLLAGVAASMFCSAAGLVVQAFATPLTAQQMMRWQLGGLEIVGYSSMICVPVIALACVALFRFCRPLELLSVDTELAATRGVSVEKTRVWTLIAAGLATSVVVSICGPIGFVGLIIPNAIRRWTGANLKTLFPMSALCGATFLMLADTISRLLERVAWIPVGVVTAVIGTPVFIYALLRRK